MQAMGMIPNARPRWTPSIKLTAIVGGELTVQLL